MSKKAKVQKQLEKLYKFFLARWRWLLAGLLIFAILLFAFLAIADHQGLFSKTDNNTYRVAFPVEGQVLAGDTINIRLDRPIRNRRVEMLDVWLNGELQEGVVSYNERDNSSIEFGPDILKEGDVIKISTRDYNRAQAEKYGKSGVYFEAERSWKYSEESLLPYPRVERQASSNPLLPEYELSFFDTVDLENLEDNLSLYVGEGKMQGERVQCFGPKTKLRSSISLIDKETALIASKTKLKRKKDPLCIYLVPKTANSQSTEPIGTIIYNPANVEPSVGQIFNPENDFYSDLRLDFDTPMYTDVDDTGDTDAFIEHRKRQKEILARRIQLRPSADIDLENIYFTPTEAVIPIKLVENTKYSIKIKPIKDIYGESTESKSIDVETGDQIYLGLRLNEGQSVYSASKLPTFSLIQFDHPKATIKLCKVGMEEYGMIEHMYLDRRDLEGADYFFEKGIDLLPTKECFTKDLEIKEDEYTSTFDIADLVSHDPDGLYFMTFEEASQRKVDENQTVHYPLFFSVVDSHITMKLSKNGKAFVWVSDLESGEGIANAEIKAHKTDYTRYTSDWNRGTREYDKTYADPQEGIFEEPVYLGKTDANGFLEFDIPAELNAYFSAIAYDWWGGRSRSLMVTAQAPETLSYLSNRWNDGIARWNFGYQPYSGGYWYSDAGIDKRGDDFLAHVFTERKLYLPGETVHLKAILREVGKTLEVPNSKEDFVIKVQDPSNEILFEETVHANEFGSITKSFETDKDTATLGIYRVDVMAAEDEGAYTIARTSFNVEEFKKPHFKVEVMLDSDGLEDGLIKSPEVNQQQTRWGYTYKEYSKKLPVDVRLYANYYSGGSVKDASYEYKVYRQYYYEQSYWNDCYWGCFYEPRKEFYSSGSGKISEAGDSSFSINIDHKSRWSDYNYIVEVTVKDDSGEIVTGAGNIIVKLPKDRSADPDVDIKNVTEEGFIDKGEELEIVLAPNKKWEAVHDDQYELEILHRTYTTTHKMNTEGNLVPQVDFEDEEVERLKVNRDNFTLQEGQLIYSFTPQETGEYIFNLLDQEDFTEESFKVYVYDEDEVSNTPIVDDSKIQVLSKKTTYKLGDEAEFLVRLPFENARILITTEKREVVDKEIIDITGNAYLHRVKVTDTFVPNAYLSFVAFQKGESDYKVGYGEILVDQSEKKLKIRSSFDLPEYRPGEEVSISFDASDIYDTPEKAELTVAVVDEALIALLGNIDMDILKKFYEKMPFQIDTSLTSVAMLNHLYFSRKGFVGGSGEKGGDSSVFTRSLFKNTAYYNPSVITDTQGRAKVTFRLPDNIGDFRVIVLASTKSNHFGAHETTFSVRKDLVIEDNFPLIFRQGDNMKLGANVFNHTDEEVEVHMNLESDGLSLKEEFQSISIPPQDRTYVTWDAVIEGKPMEEITYKITGTASNGEGDGIEKTVPVATTPLIADRSNYKNNFTDELEFEMHSDKEANTALSYVQFSLSTSLLAGIDKIVTSLLMYPHGCLEQTISSTLPNAILLKFSDLFALDINEEELHQNIDVGMKRIVDMQQADGGFGYWPGDRSTNHHYSPYGIWGLATMAELGVDVDQDILDKAEAYLVDRFKNAKDVQGEQLSEFTTALFAMAKLDSSSFSLAREVLYPHRKSFSTHERLYYALALSEYDETRYHNEIMDMIEKIDIKQKSHSYYWNSNTYKALLVQLLLQSDPDSDQLAALIQDIYQISYDSYYVSTQTKIQSFIAFKDYIEGLDSSDETVTIQYEINSKKGVMSLRGKDIIRKRKIYLKEFASSLRDSFDFSFTVNNKDNEQTVYLDADLVVHPEDPKDVTALSNGVNVSRTYFATERKKNERGRYEIKEVPIPQGKLRVGETYLVKLKIELDINARDVAIEDHLPAGIRVLNERFLTTSSETDRGWNWPFNHLEYKKNMVFAVANRLSSNKDYEFEYFVTPIVEGEYSLPPVSVFPMYQPSFEGHTGYQELQIVR